MTVTPESAAYFWDLNPNMYSGAEVVAQTVGTAEIHEVDPIMAFFRKEVAEIQQRAAERNANIRYVEPNA